MQETGHSYGLCTQSCALTQVQAYVAVADTLSSQKLYGIRGHLGDLGLQYLHIDSDELNGCGYIHAKY